MIKKIVPLTAILTLGGLEGIALSKGIDGALFMFVVAIISGLAGYNAKELLKGTKGWPAKTK